MNSLLLFNIYILWAVKKQTCLILYLYIQLDFLQPFKASTLITASYYQYQSVIQ